MWRTWFTNMRLIHLMPILPEKCKLKLKFKVLRSFTDKNSPWIWLFYTDFGMNKNPDTRYIASCQRNFYVMSERIALVFWGLCWPSEPLNPSEPSEPLTHATVRVSRYFREEKHNLLQLEIIVGISLPENRNNTAIKFNLLCTRTISTSNIRTILNYDQ